TPEDSKLQHVIGGRERRGGHHGASQGNEGGAQQYQDAPGQDPPQGSVGVHLDTAAFGGAKEEYSGKTGEHHRAGKAGQQPEQVGQHQPRGKDAYHCRTGQQVGPLFLHGQEGGGQQSTADAGSQAQDQ